MSSTTYKSEASGLPRTIALDRSSVLMWAFVVVCLIYAAQVLTPLRLDHDSIVLLSMAASASDGHGFLDHGSKTHYPPGYPAIVVGLERLGVARSWGFVGLNAISLFVGFAAAGYVALSYFSLSKNWAINVLLFTGLSFAVVKFFTIPQTDIVFFGMSLAAIALLVRAEDERGSKYYVMWAAAVVISIAAFLVRTIGITLFVTLAWSMGQHLGVLEALRRLKRRQLIAAVASLCSLVFVALIVFQNAKYVREAIAVFAKQGTNQSIRNFFLFRVHEIGELTLNVPASKLGPLASLVWVSGAIGIAILAFSVRRWKLGTVEVYLASYAFVMILWPYCDPRFWIPVLPLAFAELFSSLRPWEVIGWKRRIWLSYAIVYGLFGIAALGFSSRITFSGRDFPSLSGTDNTENLLSTYKLFHWGKRDPDAGVNEAALQLLQRYSSTGAPGSQ